MSTTKDPAREAAKTIRQFGLLSRRSDDPHTKEFHEKQEERLAKHIAAAYADLIEKARRLAVIAIQTKDDYEQETAARDLLNLLPPESK